MTFLCGSFSLTTVAQPKIFTSANAHAHNDYLHTVPFYTAYNTGFGSIEADIFPVNGILCVAHNKKEIQPQLTLKSLYLEPLIKELKANKSRRIKLLVDIKEDHELSLKLLLQEIEPLIQYLSTPQNNKQLAILISGERPLPAEYKNYPDYIFFDDDLKLTHSASEWERVGQVSLQFTRYSSWKGENFIDTIDKKRLQHVIDSVHRARKTIRFWAAPDNEASWILQTQLGVDLIGTDKIDELASFLKKNQNRKSVD
ncbi:MAG: alkaline phosphatase [Chitinophagaceae bacterium]